LPQFDRPLQEFRVIQQEFRMVFEVFHDPLFLTTLMQIANGVSEDPWLAQADKNERNHNCTNHHSTMILIHQLID
jgi:hypothetical protein